MYQNVPHLTRKGPGHSCTRTRTPKAHPAMPGFRAAGSCWEFSGCSTNTILSVALRPSCTFAPFYWHKHINLTQVQTHLLGFLMLLCVLLWTMSDHLALVHQRTYTLMWLVTTRKETILHNGKNTFHDITLYTHVHTVVQFWCKHFDCIGMKSARSVKFAS